MGRRESNPPSRRMSAFELPTLLGIVQITWLFRRLGNVVSREGRGPHPVQEKPDADAHDGDCDDEDE
jgi:hypothetical protein